MIDPDIRPLPTSMNPGTVLKAYRSLLSRTSWAAEMPDTVFGPVWTSGESAERFAEQIRQLYLAHLELLRRLLSGGPFSPAAERYAQLAGPLRDLYLDWPGLPDDLDPAQLTAEDRSTQLFGRPDVIVADDGPKVVETNFDTAIAGQERPDDMWTIACDIFAPPAEYRSSGRPLHGMSDFFVELAAGQPSQVHWIMKDDPAWRRRVTPLIDVLNRTQTLVRHTLHYPGDDLTGIDSSGGRQFLHRAVSINTVNKDRARFGELLRALRTVAPESTAPVGLSATECKLFLAWLSDPAARPSLPPQQVAAVESLLPWTRALNLLDQGDLDRVAEQRHSFVVKKAYSYQATEVHFGWNTDSERWRELLSECLADGHTWIVQRRVRPKIYQLVEYTDDGPIQRATGLACCPYLMGGKLRGLETWINPPEPDLTMLTRMRFVPHFLKGAASPASGRLATARATGMG